VTHRWGEELCLDTLMSDGVVSLHLILDHGRSLDSVHCELGLVSVIGRCVTREILQLLFLRVDLLSRQLELCLHLSIGFLERRRRGV
jgi:hypothetical protein